ncbi:MAG: hypothetical protein INR73_18085 [Williamsia sp.]|nr:hypothetical protein [Williamsia sp.]
MKNIFRAIGAVVAGVLLFDYCTKHDTIENSEAASYFLSDVRPRFFDNLNFESPQVIANIPSFLKEITQTYSKLEKDYRGGIFKSSSDLENMRLMGMYYSFYLLALTGNYLDGNIRFADIVGKQERGLYTSLSATEPGFEQKELEAMMEKARTASLLAVDINGFNDKTYGFYRAVRQVQERLKNKQHFNNPSSQDSIISYVGTRLADFDLLPDWNVLMSMVTFTNYADSLNTFKNPAMDKVLFNVNARLVPGALRDLGGKYPEILGPLYRFDLNLKKADWLLHRKSELNDEDVKALNEFINTLETASGYIETNKKALLDSWSNKETFEQRKEKMNELKNYLAGISAGRKDLPKPELETFINSKAFKKAYQCYSCHKPSGL